MTMFRRLVITAFVLAVLTGINTPFNTSAYALNKNEVDTTYYDACRDPIYERVIGCYGDVVTWGTSSAGAVYKNIVQIPCEDGQFVSTWYQWNGSVWVIIPGMPGSC
jgi:hypothetical protein